MLTADPALFHADDAAAGAPGDLLLVAAGDEHLAALDGIVQNQANMNYSLASESKGSGERIPVKVSRYLLSRGALVLAKKREVAKIPELDKKALDAFVKSNKLKWDKTEDLQKIADYISDQR